MGDRGYYIAGESFQGRAPHYKTLPNTYAPSSEADCPRSAQLFRQVRAVVVGQSVHVLDALQVLGVLAVQTMRRGCRGCTGAQRNVHQRTDHTAANT
jgi:hypothetical protein